MPYFTRQPYAATALPLDVPAALTPAGPEDFLGLAASVLGAESAGDTVQTLHLRRPLRAGQSGTLQVEIAHDGGPGTIATGLVANDLFGPAGKIESENVSFVPEYIQLTPGQSIAVTLTVTAPAGTPPGMYKGLVRSEIEDGFALRLDVPVVG